MQTNLSSRTGRITVLVMLLGLATLSVYSTRASFALRHELKEAHDELDKLKQSGQTPGSDRDDTRGESASAKDREIELLRSRLAELQEQIPAAPVPATLPQSNATTATNRVSWMEQVREQDPERYKQIMAEREQRRQRMDTYFQDQYTRLDERLKSAQTQEEVDLVNQLSATLTRADELRTEWEKTRDLPEEERRKQSEQLGTESRQVYQQLSDLRRQDRQLQLRQLASQIGYQDPKDVAAFVDTVQRINRETDSSSGRFFGRRGGQQQP